MAVEITVNNGDSSLLAPLLATNWRYLIPPLSEEVISYAVITDSGHGINTLLLFASEAVGSKKLVPNSYPIDIATDIADFVGQWLREDKSIKLPPTAFGGTYFPGFWLSNVDLPNHEGVMPFLAVRHIWVFYEQ